MKYYIIETVTKATEQNDNYKGAIHRTYTARGGNWVDDYNAYSQELIQMSNPVEWKVKDYGYKRMCDAVKGLKSALDLCNWQNERGFWNSTARIVEYEC